LALDYGLKHVGLARTDELALTVVPLPSIPNPGRDKLIEKIRRVVLEHDIHVLVVGMPWNMDGSSGQAVSRVERLIEALKNALQLPVHGVDERLSTLEAEDVWRSLNPRRQKVYRTADSLAAALILRRFLEEC